MVGTAGCAIAVARCPSEPNIFTTNAGASRPCSLGGNALSMLTAPDIMSWYSLPNSAGWHWLANPLARRAIMYAVSFQVLRSSSSCFSGGSAANLVSAFSRRLAAPEGALFRISVFWGFGSPDGSPEPVVMAGIVCPLTWPTGPRDGGVDTRVRGWPLPVHNLWITCGKPVDNIMAGMAWFLL